MAKVGFVNRQSKRVRMSNNDAAKRAELKAKIINEELGFDERMEARNQLNKMRTNGSKIRFA